MEEDEVSQVVVREHRISKSDGRRKTIETTNLTRVKKTPSKPNKHDDSVKRSKSTIKYNSATMKEISAYSSVKAANNQNRLSNLLSSPRSPRALSARDAEVLVRQAVSDATKCRNEGGDTPSGKLCRSSSDQTIVWTSNPTDPTFSDERHTHTTTYDSTSKENEAMVFSDTDLLECQRCGIKTYLVDNKNMIYGGTFPMIIDTLLEWMVTEPDRAEIYKLISIFLFSYRKYAKEVECLQHLIHYWNEPAPIAFNQKEKEGWFAKRRTAVTFFLSNWFDVQYIDFENGRALQMLDAFLDEIPHEYKKPLIAKIQNAIKQRPTPSLYLFEPSKVIKGKLEPGKFGFLDIKTRQIAEQWTLLDMRNFMSITRSEYVQIGKSSPNWEKMLRRGALISRWVASEVVQNVQMSKRVEVFRRFINVAIRFLEINNFNGAMCIWGGLNTVSVHRLTKTKKKLPKQVLDIWNSLESNFSEENNFGGVRKATKKKLNNKEPVVPWFELINKARNSVSEYADYLPSALPTDPPLLNFSKIHLMGEQILTFENYKRAIENVDLYHEEDNKLDSMIRTYLEHLPTYPDEVLWKMSCRCEPED
jgi:hypothetical protein